MQFNGTMRDLYDQYKILKRQQPEMLPMLTERTIDVKNKWDEINTFSKKYNKLSDLVKNHPEVQSGAVSAELVRKKQKLQAGLGMKKKVYGIREYISQRTYIEEKGLEDLPQRRHKRKKKSEIKAELAEYETHKNIKEEIAILEVPEMLKYMGVYLEDVISDTRRRQYEVYEWETLYNATPIFISHDYEGTKWGYASDLLSLKYNTPARLNNVYRPALSRSCKFPQIIVS